MKRIFLNLLSASIFFSISEAADFSKKHQKREIFSAINNNLKSDVYLKNPKSQQNLLGEVINIDSTAGKIALKTETSATVTISTNDKTAFRRVQPGQTSLANAEQITFAQIKTGDRILVPGGALNEQTPVRQVIVMAREAINAQRSLELENRRERTTVGRVTALNPQTKEITVQSRGRGAAETLIVSPAADAKFLKFAPDSLKISDALPGSFADLRVGDQVRILGDRNTGNQVRLTAEEIISGSITRSIGSIVEVNAAANQIVVKDARSGQTMTVAIGKNTTLRRIPQEVAQTLKERISQRSERQGDRGNRQTAENSQSRQRENQQIRRGNRRQNANSNKNQQNQGNRGIQQTFENLPLIAVSDLKKGDAIMITGTGEADNSRLTAVSIITGDPDLEQVLLRTQGGRNNQSPGSPGLPGNVGGGNGIDDDDPRK